MRENKVGQLILTKRKELGYTQQDLGELLNVSSKTISKWECGYGLPDITIIKKLSNEFGITIEELLDGEIKTEGNLNKNKKDNQKWNKKILNYKIISILIIILIIFGMIYIKTKNKNKIEEESLTKMNNCTVIKTYNIKNIEPSNDGNYLYVTVTEYQVEGVFTIKLPKSVSKDLKNNSSYVFTFKTTEENLTVTTDVLFNNSEIINIKYTEKTGMETESKSYCNN